MSCEGKDLNTLTQNELRKAHHFHAWRAFTPIQEGIGSEEVRQREKHDVDRIGQIHRAYLDRFGSRALINLVKSLNELKGGEIL